VQQPAAATSALCFLSPQRCRRRTLRGALQGTTSSRDSTEKDR
jgi:hypothetical protein